MIAWRGMAAARTPLKIMSFNIRYDNEADGPNRWAQRRSSALALIHDEDPDLLGVQEALPNQLADLQAGLPGYDVASFGRDGPWAGERLALFSKRPLVSSGGFWLSETPDRPSVGWDASLARVAVWGRAQSAVGPVSVLVTHLDHLGPQARRASAHQLKAWLAAQGGPAIVLGDFNADPAGPAHQILVGPQAPPLRDAYAELHREESGGTFHNWGEMFVPHRIDWILCTPHFDVLEAQILRARPGGQWPSDHYPVSAVLRPKL